MRARWLARAHDLQSHIFYLEIQVNRNMCVDDVNVDFFYVHVIH